MYKKSYLLIPFVVFLSKHDLTLVQQINTLNAELNPIFHLLALLGAHHIIHVSRIRVKFRKVNFLICENPVLI
jgi:hypothetical protein